jgi:hypothetical protein
MQEKGPTDATASRQNLHGYARHKYFAPQRTQRSEGKRTTIPVGHGLNRINLKSIFDLKTLTSVSIMLLQTFK